VRGFWRLANAERWQQAPGIYRRGSKYVVVYRVGGRQRKQHADTLAQARAIKLERN
jgi:hypothetical protein